MFREFIFGALLLSVATLGCGGSLPVKLYPAKGTVVYQGKPVANCIITLIPLTPVKGLGGDTGKKGDQAQELAFTGKLNAEGKFYLASTPGSKAGAAVGKYKVVLTLPPDEAQKAMMGGGKKAYMSAAPFPVEYGSAGTTKKEVEITAGSNDLLIDL
jgi:hypothetical protein